MALSTLRSFAIPRRAALLGGGAACALAACGGKDQTQDVKELKTEVQAAYGDKDFAKGYDLSTKGLAMAREVLGDKHPDTLYFAQGISRNAYALHNMQGALKALKQEVALRSAAGQKEKKLQSRRTLLIQIAEENGDRATSIEQTVIIAKAIGMAAGKDPQPTYRPEPSYPADMARQKIEGDVDLGFNLDPNGTPNSVRVIHSVPASVFDVAAMENFRRWRFTPMIENGQPVASTGHHFLLAFRMTKEKPPSSDD